MPTVNASAPSSDTRSRHLVRLLQIEPTTRCNFSCGFCVGRQLDQNDISLETFRHALNLFPDVEHIETHGEGEPLLHRDYFEMTRLARERGIHISATTNGSMFSPGRIEKILDSGIQTIFVSIESPDPDDFNDIRGGNLSKVVSGIKALLEARNARAQALPTLGFSVTILKRTQHLMPAIAQLYADIGMDGGISAHMLNTMPAYTWAYKNGMADQVLSKLEQGLAWARYARIMQSPEYQRTTSAVHFADEIFGQIAPPDEDKPCKNRLAKDYRSCPWLDEALFINRHSKATGCARIKDADRFGFGDINQDSPDSILEERERIGRQVRAGQTPEACAGCFVAEAIENRISRLRGSKPAATGMEVTRTAWEESMRDHVIGAIPYDHETIAALLERAHGMLTTAEIVEALGTEWQIEEDAAATRILPILSELAHMGAVTLTPHLA